MPRVVKRPDLRPSALALEPTFSPEETGAHLGVGATATAELIALGKQFGRELHPTRGGLWPTFLSGKHRRIPLSAIDRHKRHIARINGEAEPAPTLLIETRLVEVSQPEEAATS
jgi:hypothetical protein